MYKEHASEPPSGDPSKADDSATGAKPPEDSESEHEAVVAKLARFRGLCATCKHALTCTFPRNENRPVMFCEEFEGYDTRSTGPMPPQASVHSASQTPSVSASQDPTLKGLCVSCARRDTCTFPKPEGGVWQCEEFE